MSIFAQIAAAVSIYGSVILIIKEAEEAEEADKTPTWCRGRPVNPTLAPNLNPLRL